MAHKMTLGETRRFAPCLPNELLSYFASLPIEYPGNGHPGVLFYRKDGEVMEEREGMVEMWIEASVSTPHPILRPLTHAAAPH